MFRKILSVALAGLLIQLACAYPAFAATDSKKDIERAEKVRNGVARLGTGPDARVKLKLKDKTKYEGYISEAGADGFSITDAKTGNTADIAYSEVKQIKGNNLSTGAKIAIGIGIGAGAVLLIVFLVIASND
jgi:hypothetical protein